MINILPIEGGRIRCERVWESICPSCLDNMMQHASVDDIAAMLEVLDPLSAWRAKQRINSLRGALD